MTWGIFQIQVSMHFLLTVFVARETSNSRVVVIDYGIPVCTLVFTLKLKVNNVSFENCQRI